MELTKEQQEYFKDSKIRDESGNLLVCYHGSSTPGFSEFEHNNLTPTSSNNINEEKETLKECLVKDLLVEATRQQQLNKSRNADSYKDTRKGRNRYERRTKSRIPTQVKNFNNIDMNTLFKKDELNVVIDIIGETNTYQVKIRFKDVLRELQKRVKDNNNILDYRVIFQSLITLMNSNDVWVSCNCKDYLYRIKYHNTKNNIDSSDQPELRPSDITNPNDSKGTGCKHILLVLSNLDWLVKVASVINNYIKYCEKYMQRNYADIIFPKIYGMPYNKAIQLGILDIENENELPTDKKTLDTSTARGYQGKDAKGRFTKDNPYKFQKKDLNNEMNSQDRNLTR